MKQTYTTSDVDISHTDLIKLREQGKLNLGMDNQAAMQIHTTGHGSKKSTSDLATIVYTWIAIGVFIVSIYYSFTDRWWWFIVGFVVMRVIWRAVKSATPQNYLNDAMHDLEFYDKLKIANIWLYEMEEVDAIPFFKYGKLVSTIEANPHDSEAIMSSVRSRVDLNT